MNNRDKRFSADFLGISLLIQNIEDGYNHEKTTPS